MRILFLLSQDLDSPGGGGRYFPLARALARRGHQVAIAGLHSSYAGLEQKRFPLEGVQIEYAAPMHVRKTGSLKSYYPLYRLVPLMAWATFGLAWAALREHFDILHIGKPHPMNSLAGLFARSLRGGKLWVDVDDYEAATNRFSGGWQKRVVSYFEDIVPRKADYVTTHTGFLRQRLLELGVPQEQICYLPNGYEPERFSAARPEAIAALREELGLSGRKVVAFIGSLSLVSHPVDLLVEAFRIVCAAEPEARLLFVGGGEDLPQLQEQVAEADLGEKVIFRGKVPFSQAPRYYQMADVTVDPVYDNEVARSRQPLKLVESWAAGAPFITADVGDRRSLLGEPPAGLLACPGDPASLAGAILSVLQDADFAASLRTLGYERVRAYRWEQIAAGQETQYLRSLQ
jgi:glycosyltransferase involved in cell wall biosynthesis